MIVNTSNTKEFLKNKVGDLDQMTEKVLIVKDYIGKKIPYVLEFDSDSMEFTATLTAKIAPISLSKKVAFVVSQGSILTAKLHIPDATIWLGDLQVV